MSDITERPPAPPRASTWAVPQRPTLLVLAIVLILAAGAIGYAVHGSRSSTPAGRITVTGAATVMGVPDSVTFTIGVHTTNVNAETCLNYNDRRVAALERALTGAGVPIKGLQTSNLQIYDNTNRYGEVTGFTVDDTLDVTMTDIADAGHAIEVAAKTAGNGIELDGISFSLVNDPSLMATARMKAITQAHQQAADLVRASGASLSGVLTITDLENSSSSTHYGEPLGSLNAGALTVPIQAGQQAVTVQVTVVYALSN